MEDILKIVKSLEDFGILLKEVSETIKNEAKEQRCGFLSILLGTLCTSLLGNVLAGKGVARAGEGTAKVGNGSKRSSVKRSSLKIFIASFDYFNKSLIVLSATSGSISIASFATVIGTPVGIASANLSLAFSLSTGIVKDY